MPPASERTANPKQNNNTTLSQLSQERATKSNAIEIPQITLPKGGGALKGIDEKFQVNPVNGTAGFSIPLPLSPNRNGFTPQLSLSYNSGVGNGLFGIGWDIDLPAIQRRTDKKLPRYFDSNDAEDVEAIKAEDSFMFSGVEELVPYLKADLTIKQDPKGDFIIRHYRPRIEGGFSRIERIYQKSTNSYYWRVTSKDNITTFFGYSESCRIYDTSDPNDTTKVFQWLPEFSFDDKGSWVWYEYKAESLKGVEEDVHEQNRFNRNAPFTNKHLKRIKYGNKDAYYIDKTKPYEAQLPPKTVVHFFDLAFDYGDYDLANPTLEDDKQVLENGKLVDVWKGKARADAFSSYRSCFEMRTYRLCKRVLMFHTFPNKTNGEVRLNNGKPTLVRSINFEYKYSSIYKKEEDTHQIETDAIKEAKRKNAELTYLISIEQIGYVKNVATYSHKSLPKMTFDYQELSWGKDIKTVSSENLVHAPVGLSSNYQWTDLYNEGINGILTEQANGWFYKSNLGQVQADNEKLGDLHFSHAQPVIPKPSFTGLSNGTLQLQDLDANGEKQLVVNTEGVHGYFELNDEGEWQPFKAFLKNLNLDLRDPNVRMLDVNGDGKPEVVLSDLGAFWFWENQGKIGYDAPELAIKPYDEERGASIVFSDQEQRIFLADMSGDGLTDIVRIRNGEVCYWANMGYGRFSAKVTMGNSPVFDNPDMFNPSYIQLADISGTGATDIIYLGKNQFSAYLNCCGNRWTDAEEIDPFFPTEQPNKITVTDLLGNGTACIVWSSEMPAYSAAPMRYIDLMGGKKPHIMQSHKNGFGKMTTVEYKSSTYFYLKDKLEGTPWITKLAFPVQLVTKTIVTDSVTNVRFTAQYSYHHGYYDHAEREFRGFGRVEQLDTEYFDVFTKTSPSNTVPVEHHQPPVLTKTWFHTGAFLDKERILTQFKKEYWFRRDVALQRLYTNGKIIEYELPDAVLLAADNLTNFDINNLSADEWRESLRACKGMTLRQEVFGLDAEKRIDDEKKAKNYADNDPKLKKFQDKAKETEQVPYSVATHNCEIQLLQERNKNRYGVFMVKESEAITYAYERNPEDPRIAHTLTIETDELGNVLESVSVVYPRFKVEDILIETVADRSNPVIQKAKATARAGQKKQWITFTKNDFTKSEITPNVFEKDIITPENYYLRKGWQSKTYELTGFTLANPNPIFKVSDFKGIFNTLPPIEYHVLPTLGLKEKRLIEHVKTKFYNEDLTASLPDGQMAIRGIPFEAYQLAYTRSLIDAIFKPTASSANFFVSDLDMRNGKFLQENTDGSPIIENPAPEIQNPKSIWWIQSGTVKYRRTGENFNDIKNHFFAPVGFIDPFDSESEVLYDNLTLFMEHSKDALGNESHVLKFNYRTLSPTIMRDINDNISSVIVDELGLVKAAAVEGKVGNNPLQGIQGDNLDNFTEYTEGVEAQNIADFFNIANTVAPQICDYTALKQKARSLLGKASARMVYDFSKKPTVVASIVREIHAKQDVNNNSPLQISFEYSDGLGKVAMKKVQAETGIVKAPDGTDIDTGNQVRWVGNGRTVLNNKGNPIKQYEPYFSTTPAYENDPAWVERGVSPTIYYDGAGRNVKTELPNSTFTKVEFDAWKQLTYDVNDTVEDSIWKTKPENAAAYLKTKSHNDTPSIIVLDTLGRPTLGIDLLVPLKKGLNGELLPFGAGGHCTTSELDIEGNALSVTDARGNVVMSWRYDMLGHRVAQTSMDAGKRWMLNNALGNPVKTWDENGIKNPLNNTISHYELRVFTTKYDVLHRPTDTILNKNGQSYKIEHIEYGTDATLNLIGQIHIHQDGSGQTTNVRYDFKGNLLQTQKRIPHNYKDEIVDWTTRQTFDPDTYTLQTEYDALNRMSKMYNWHFENTNGETRVAVYLPKYSKRGVLESEDLIVNALKTTNSYLIDLKTTQSNVVKDITYDAKGQRMRMRQNDGKTTTRYTYDPFTFRLIQLRTTKHDIDPYVPFVKSNLNDLNVLQNLFYTYDPVGNITEIEDDAYETVFFNNQRVESKSKYEYDALYRLIKASGREQPRHIPQPKDFNWAPKTFPITDKTLQNYDEFYTYDAVGNILKMQHSADSSPWTRNYQYAKDSNRLLATKEGSNLNYEFYIEEGDVNTLPLATQYRYDIHGNMLNLHKTPDDLITWDYRDMIQKYDLKNQHTAYYQYSNDKQRSRKVIEKNTSPMGAGGIKEERLYLGGMERYRRWQVNSLGVVDKLVEEIETLHVFEGEHRILIVEDVKKTNNTQNTEGVLYRYQYSNHLGSASLEMEGSDTPRIISYEEYHPYGTTAYQAKNATIKCAAKRYRYTGMERDKETGLAYHSARYYLPWLGRWGSCDPIGIEDGINIYLYVNENPIIKYDPLGKKGWKDELNIMERFALWVDEKAGSENIKKVSDFSAGFGDVLSFGLTDKIRTAMGTNSVVDKDSASYNYGGASGVVLQTAIAAATVPLSVARFGAAATARGLFVSTVAMSGANYVSDKFDPTQTVSGVLNTVASLGLPLLMTSNKTPSTGSNASQPSLLSLQGLRALLIKNSSNDKAWAKLTFKQKILYEIGTKGLEDGVFKKLTQGDSIPSILERGMELSRGGKLLGILKASLPSYEGLKGAFSLKKPQGFKESGVTPATRWILFSLPGGQNLFQSLKETNSAPVRK